MKKYQDSLIPEGWKKVAKKEWERTNGWKLRKIHELHDLLNDAISYNQSLEKFRNLCERVSGYYLIERYPLPIPTELTSKDIEKDLVEAKELIHMIFPEEELND